MTTWREARSKLHAANPQLKEEYDRLGPRFKTLSKLIGARQQLGISQSELARRMDVPANVVSRFESARHSPRLDTIIAYADALGYDLTVVLTKQRDCRGKRTPASRSSSSRAASSR
ncbi:MAG TPA: helix-turn-helix transcriptional regulator [Dehalococcoidia bacterium]|nr:helix-turn-helix transcriptional regulator [Dehalococcoidia bacterium]